MISISLYKRQIIRIKWICIRLHSKWIDIIAIKGTSYCLKTSWNHQAKFILKVAMVLEDNKAYADEGREYYIDYMLNKSSARQWSLTKFMEYGYDPDNGVWANVGRAGGNKGP